MVSEGHEDFGGSGPIMSKWDDLKGRQLRANQELKRKANELEKIYAEHKLRVPLLNDKNAATKPLTSSTNMSKNSRVNPQLKALDDRDHNDAKMQKLSEFGDSGYCRGPLYESYVQKRDAKLREEWGSKKEEKEAKMKAMRDRFERSAAEVKAKLSSKTCEERSESSNSRSTMATDESKDEKDVYVGNDGSKSSQAKKPPNQNLPSSIPAPSAIPILRSSTKIPNSSSGGGILQPKEALAHFVANISDLRKENPKRSSGVSKIVTRPSAKTHARSTSCIENTIVVKEERKPRHSQLGLALTPPKSDKSDRYSQNSESKLFCKKGSSLRPGARAAMAKMEGSMQSKSVNYEVKLTENEVNKGSETAKTVDHVIVDNVKPRLSHETKKSVGSRSEGDDALRSSSQVKTSVAKLATTLHPVGSVQNFPAERPFLWNSRAQHALSYSNETSDIDASSIESPASCNSGSLNQVEAGAARMRKKWGTTQKTNLVSNPSNGHSRKDVTGGFKKLLHLGRKSRGTDTSVDSISATTSKGDDGKRGLLPDRLNGSEYLSKQGQALRSSFPISSVNFKLKEHHLPQSSIKAPRSLFSLSSFRSKGSNSKPR